MKRDRYVERLKATGTSQSAACRDMGISQTTMLRWREAPGYAEVYLVALEIMTEAGRMTLRHKLALERLPEEEL